jgi:hypothetical protein
MHGNHVLLAIDKLVFKHPESTEARVIYQVIHRALLTKRLNGTSHTLEGTQISLDNMQLNTPSQFFGQGSEAITAPGDTDNKLTAIGQRSAKFCAHTGGCSGNQSRCFMG